VSYILAIESDPRQAAALKRVAKERVGAELTVVDTKDAAISSVERRLPDLILVTALFSPREEGELIAHLRTLTGAEHLQTLTIPLLATTGDGAPRRGLFQFRRKADIETPGCDPDIFAEQINSYLKTAADLKATAEARRQYIAARAAVLPIEEVAPEPAPILRDAVDRVDDTVAEPRSDFVFPPFEEPATPSAPRSPLVSFSAETLGELLEKESKIDASATESSVEPSAIGVSPVSIEPSPDVEASADYEVSPAKAPASVVEPQAAIEPALAVDAARDAEPEPVVEPVVVIEPPIGIESPPVRLVQRLPPLARWATIQTPDRETSNTDTPAHGATDVNELLESLRVPGLVLSISYPQGCRIRRVRTATFRNQNAVVSVPIETRAPRER
jgi:hypothetical protein